MTTVVVAVGFRVILLFYSVTVNNNKYIYKYHNKEVFYF